MEVLLGLAFVLAQMVSYSKACFPSLLAGWLVASPAEL